jgi:hypothetical protein
MSLQLQARYGSRVSRFHGKGALDAGARRRSGRLQQSLRHRSAQRERRRIEPAGLDISSADLPLGAPPHRGQHCVARILPRTGQRALAHAPAQNTRRADRPERARGL